MPAKKKRSPRFAYREIVLRIEEARRRANMTAKDLAEASGLDAPRWSRKVRGEGNAFTLEEFSAIADALEAPEGWPFVDWARAALFAALERKP